MQILKMIGYAAGGSVVVGLLLGGVFELIRAVQIRMPQSIPHFPTSKPTAKI
jgi:hypothetical protein